MDDPTPSGPGQDADAPARDAGRDLVVRRAEVVASRPAPPVSRARAALLTARRLATHPAVVASASAVAAVVAHEGVSAAARHLAVRAGQAAPTGQPAPVVVVIQVVDVVVVRR